MIAYAIGLMRTVCQCSPFALFIRFLLPGRTHLSAGNWRGVLRETLEDAEKQLKGEEKGLFLSFAKKILRWKPEERSSAKELLAEQGLTAEPCVDR